MPPNEDLPWPDVPNPETTGPPTGVTVQGTLPQVENREGGGPSVKVGDREIYFPRDVPLPDPQNPVMNSDAAMSAGRHQVSRNNEDAYSVPLRPTSVGQEIIAGFKDGHTRIVEKSQNNGNNVAEHHHEYWNDIANHIRDQVITELNNLIREIEPGGSVVPLMSGSTAQRILKEAKTVRDALEYVRSAAHRMDGLVNIFQSDFHVTQDWFKAYYAPYCILVENNDGKTPGLGSKDDWKQQFDTWADNVVDSYNPPIEFVNSNLPDLSAAVPQEPVAPNTTATPTGLPSGQGLSMPGTGTPAEFLTPSSFTPEATTPESTNPSNTSTSPTSSGSGQNGGQSGSGASDGLKNAANQALGAGKNALGALNSDDPADSGSDTAMTSGFTGVPGMPTGGVGRGGTGSGSPRLATSRPATQGVAAGTGDRLRAAQVKSSAGLSSGTSGATGAGAPMGGRQGGGPGSGKEHKYAKALHRQYSVADEGEAVRRVLGEVEEGEVKTT